ncbi:hemolysin family protein [Nesterenkonia flava]|uniref:Hemolysin family protein n=1 Tax=Nesterenkonia flava TaxID=469799 RepID=A0ABU1FWK0_9MICC|nr:hemolysin family protein [Nesterenkonia flava]MDR5712697.1 hemolysin family protein [Nesterenkonia flava]
MSEWLIPLLATAGIIVLSAFFVIIEFSLLAARRHRLEESAETSRTSRAALRSLNELTIMLAGAQLGITACTFALGAVSKPAVHYALTPVLAALNLPAWAADALAFGLALLLMTFLHLVVGEMAPKSWAIAHPELSARVVAVPSRVFIRIFRPLLKWINSIANRLVAATGVEPVDRAAAGGYDSETIRHLVEHSTRAGVLDQASGTQISSIIELESLTVGDVLAERQGAQAPTVPATATAREVQRAAHRSGELRVLLTPLAAAPLIVHVRDTLSVPEDSAARQLARPALVVSAEASVYEAFQQMRAAGEQLAVVRAGHAFAGVLTWNDILHRVWPNMEEQWV